jgi:hypothetical protein
MQIPEEGGFGTQNFQLPMNLNRSTNTNITIKPLFWVCAVSGCRSSHDNALSGFVKLINKMAKFRKKPVVIEAVQWNADKKNFDEVMNFMQDFHGSKLNYENAEEIAYKSKELHIKTLEGVMTASNLDWIIKGVSCEFYPCKPDIFEKTYEAVEE